MVNLLSDDFKECPPNLEENDTYVSYNIYCAYIPQHEQRIFNRI